MNEIENNNKETKQKEKKPLSGSAKNRIYLGIMAFFLIVIIILIVVLINAYRQNEELKKEQSNLLSSISLREDEKIESSVLFIDD
ncbi:MAG: hypothetical protein WCR67_05785 [Bacilli bacterium]